MMKLWGYFEQRGAWITIDQDITEACEKKGIDCPEKIQGEQRLVEFVENNEKFKKFILKQIESNF